MTIREQNLETVAPILATFNIHQTTGTDDLVDADIGKAVKLTGNYEVGPCDDESILLGKLIALTLTDNDNGERKATVQIGGICKLATASTYPTVGDRVVIRQGARGIGRVTEASRGKSFGRGAFLDFALDSVTAMDGSSISIRSPRDRRKEHDMSSDATSYLFFPGFMVTGLTKGNEVGIRAGTGLVAFVDGDHTVLRSAGREGGD